MCRFHTNGKNAKTLPGCCKLEVPETAVLFCLCPLSRGALWMRREYWQHSEGASISLYFLVACGCRSNYLPPPLSMAQQPFVVYGLLIIEGFTITLRHTAPGRAPLVVWSARCRDLYLTTYNIHKTQTSMPPVGFEPVFPASNRPHTYTLDRAVTGVNCLSNTCRIS